jgi:hypothetical protein
MNKNTIKNVAVTTGLVGLVAGNVAGQTNDTTRIVKYEPFPIVKIGEGYNFGGRYGSKYELNSISNILHDYDEGKIRPDTIIGDIEVDHFREKRIPGFAEYKMTPKDNIAAVTMANCLNNTDNGQEIGEITDAETYTIYRALRKAGYLQNKGDRVKVLFPRTDDEGFGTINGKKAIFPAGNYLRAAVFVYEGDEKKPCTNCDEDENLNSTHGRMTRIDRDTIAKTFKWGPEISVVYTNGNKDINWMPQLGLFGKYGRMGFGLTGAYMQNSGKDAILFANMQNNGFTRDSTNTVTKIGSGGVKASFDIAKAVSACLHLENNYVGQTINGAVRTVVSDGHNTLDETVQKPETKNSRNYLTWGPELDLNLGKNKNFSLITGARFYFDKKFGPKAFEGAYFGGRITF